MKRKLTNAVLIFNPAARDAGKADLVEIVAALKDAGINPLYQHTAQEDDLEEIIESCTDPVIVAGGDGTIRSAAIRVFSKGLPLIPLPMGTANNFMRSLGYEEPALNLITRLSDPLKVSIDIGRVNAPWGVDYFIEGMGFGLFADMLEEYRPVTDKKILRGVNSFLKTITDYKTYDQKILIDKKGFEGNYVLVEILNSNSVGPRLPLAPKAKLTDGKLEVVLVEEKENLAKLAVGLVSKNIEKLEGVKTISCKKVEFSWWGFPVHIDEKVKPDINEKINYWYNYAKTENIKEKTQEIINIKIDVLPGALKLWLPKNE